MSNHFVTFRLENGELPVPVFECREPVNAACRTYCETCVSEQREECQCDYVEVENADGTVTEGRTPEMTDGHPCTYIEWMTEDIFELYAGDTVTLTGPEPQPVVFIWEGDYFLWEFAS